MTALWQLLACWCCPPALRPEPIMNVPRSVADVLNDHVVFEVECIDRMYCNVYIPGLQFAAGLVGYVHRQMGLPIASTAPIAKISDRFSAAVHRFARDQQVPWVDFARGQRKDDVMQEYLARYPQTQGVVFIGRAQEKTALFRTEKRRNAQGVSYPWIVKSTGMVNHYYFYCVDEDFGPFFIKFCSYFPYNAHPCPTEITGPSTRQPRRGSGSPRWTTRSPQSRTLPGCSRSATGSDPTRFRRCWTSGWRSCPTRRPARTAMPGNGTTYRSCRLSSP